MLAGVPSRRPSHSSTSAAPADSAGRSVSSTSSTIATPSLTASRTACSAGDGVWWTTSRRGTCASWPWSSVGVPAGTRLTGQRNSGLGGEAAGEVAVAHEDADGIAQVHAVVALLQGLGEGWFAVGEEDTAETGDVACRCCLGGRGEGGAET